MSLKFFRPWEDHGEASSSQARTHGQVSAAEAPEAGRQPQVHSGWIFLPEQRSDPGNALLSLEPIAGSERTTFHAGKPDKDADCHGDSTMQERRHDLVNTWGRSCFTAPSTDGSGTRFLFNSLGEHLSLANALQMICTQTVSPITESTATSDSSRHSSSSSCPRNSEAETNVLANITPFRTQKPGQNLAIVKGSNRLVNSTGSDKALKMQSELLPFERRQNEQDLLASSNFHEKEGHVKSKSFKCTSCNKAFSRSSHLCVHERTHTGSKPFNCRFCERYFTQISHLQSHERTHTGSKPFKCTVCMKVFTQSSHLRVHEKTHMRQRPFQCRICGKNFVLTSHLQVHERTHTGSKPFNCRFCEKAFAQSGSLHKHERTHTGSKPFKCTVCTKTFTQSSHLRVHERIHTGSRPFQCRFCNKSFTHSCNLHRHERSHTG